MHIYMYIYIDGFLKKKHNLNSSKIQDKSIPLLLIDIL